MHFPKTTQKGKKKFTNKTVLITFAINHVMQFVVFFEKHFTELVSGWRFQQTARNFGYIFKKEKLKNKIKHFNQATITWYFRKQIEVILWQLLYV